MIIRLKVFEQTLTVINTKSVPRMGSKDYLILQFSFSSDWNDLSKLCYLQKDEISQPIDIVDGLAEVPEWFTQQESFDVTLFGKAGDKEVPTNVVSMRLEKSNTLWKNDAPEPQPSWIGKIIDLNNHPPVPGDNGFWLIWDTDNGIYAESDLPLPTDDGAQSDYEQNDSSQADYIKNRTHWKEESGSEEVVIFDKTITTDGDGVYGETTSLENIAVGDTVNVEWDGTLYECEVAEKTLFDEYTAAVIGSMKPFDESYAGTEPFFILPFVDLELNSGMGIQALNGEGTYTVKITKSGGSATVYHKLDNEYLNLDETPTEGSGNPVTSGGVYNAIKSAIGAALEGSY